MTLNPRPEEPSRTPRKLPDIQVLIPYRDLVELLQASQELKDLRKEISHLRDQQGALRLQFTELMEMLQDL